MSKFITTEELYRFFLTQNQAITTDTRKIIKGSLFFALKGENFNANHFAKEALAQGCAYAVVDDESISGEKNMLLVPDVLLAMQQLARYHRQQLTCTIIGITGSNGKTTNKELIYSVLSKKYKTYATKGNLNNHIGVPLTLLSLTTSDEMAIVEMGANHQGEIKLLCDIADPDYGLITNIGKAHLEGFGGVEGIKKGKGEMYKHLMAKGGEIFINADDPVLCEMAGSLEKITYGEDSRYDVHGKSFINSEYVEFKWNLKGEPLDKSPLVKTHMFGHYNFINLLCAACIGNYFKVNENDINDALSNYIPEMNRSQVKKTDKNTLILDAYNANPSSMELAIRNFLGHSVSHKLVVLGDMLELGDYAGEEHEKILRQLSGADVQGFIVGPVFNQFAAKYTSFIFFMDVDELCSYLKEHVVVQKTILIKGSRGMKLEKATEFL